MEFVSNTWLIGALTAIIGTLAALLISIVFWVIRDHNRRIGKLEVDVGSLAKSIEGYILDNNRRLTNIEGMLQKHIDKGHT